MGGPSTKVLGPPPPLSQLTGDTKQRKGVIQHRAHLAGSSSTVVLGANRPQTARTLSGTVVRGRGGGGGGAGGRRREDAAGGKAVATTTPRPEVVAARYKNRSWRTTSPNGLARRMVMKMVVSKTLTTTGRRRLRRRYPEANHVCVVRRTGVQKCTGNGRGAHSANGRDARS